MSSLLKKMAADFRTSLATKIAVGGTTGSLQSVLDDDGIALPNGSYYFTLDSDSAQKEHIRATLTGSALSGIYSVSRQGVESSGMVREHRIGATVTITDFAHILMHNELLNGNAALDGSSPLKYDAHPTFSDDKQIVDKKYVDDVAISGAPDASTTVKGIVEQATAGEVTSGDATGGTGAKLFATPADISAKIQAGGWTYAVEDGSGSDDTYTFSFTPAPSAYTAGMMFLVKLTVANTGACTGNANSLGAKNIKKYVLGAKADLETGDIVANMACLFYYDGTDLVLVNSSAGMVTTATLTAINSFFGSTKTQGLKTTFTTGEALAAGDIVAVTSADTVKRFAPLTMPTTYDQSAAEAATISGSGSCFACICVNVSSALKAFYYPSANNGTDAPTMTRVPITATTGVVGTITSIANTTNTACLNVGAVAAGTNKVIVTACKVDAFTARTYDLTSDVSTSAAITIDSSNVAEGFPIYISDSHVLFIAHDTSNGNIQFSKYTLSGTTLSSATTGTVTTALAGKSYALKGVFLFPGTTDVLIIVQNTTDSTAQAFVATYNTGASTFSIGALTNFTSVSVTSGIDAVFAALSATQMFMACGTSTTAGSIYLVTKSGTTITMSSATAMTTRSSTGMYSVTALNARCAMMSSMNSTTATRQLLEMDSSGSNFVVRASDTETSVTACNFGFYVNPLRVGNMSINNSTGDPTVRDGLWILPNVIGVVDSAAAISTTVDVTTNGYVANVSGLTAASKYYNDIGGLLTTDSNGTPIKVGVAKDTNELIISIN